MAPLDIVEIGRIIYRRLQSCFGERRSERSITYDARVGDSPLNAVTHSVDCNVNITGFCYCDGEGRFGFPTMYPWLNDNEEDQKLRAKLLKKSELTEGQRPVNSDSLPPGVYGSIDVFMEYVESGIAAKDYDRIINQKRIEFISAFDLNRRQFAFPVIRVNQEMPTYGVPPSQSPTPE